MGKLKILSTLTILIYKKFINNTDNLISVANVVQKQYGEIYKESSASDFFTDSLALASCSILHITQMGKHSL